MFWSKRPLSGHHYKILKMRCNVMQARDVGSHVSYKVYIKLYEIIGLVILWPVIMSDLCIKDWNEIFMCLKFVTVSELIIESHVLATWCKTCSRYYYVPSVQQKSSGLIFPKSRTGSHLMYSCRHSSNRFTFPIFVHSWRFSVFHS